MNHSILKQIIYDQHEIIKNFNIVDRNYSFEPNGNYVLVGLRRAGKSTLLYKLVQDLIKNGTDWNQIIYINFEDERLGEFTASDFNDILSVQAELCDKKAFFFFDEIQNITGWEKFARRMADSKERVFITGSNAKMLSSEIESNLGGRYLTKYIWPYSFEEFLRGKKIEVSDKTITQTKSQGILKREFEEYFQFGGFPESLDFIDKRNYVTSIYQKILLGDIALRNGIRNPNGLKLLIKKIAESVKTEISYSKLHNILKTIGVSISKDSVIDYTKYAEESFIIFSIHNYIGKFAEKESNPKYYFSDNGLLNLFLNDKDTSLLENIVAISLYKKYKDDLCYLKSLSSDIDIDFYIASKDTAIQVAYSLENISDNREIENLVKLSKTDSSVKEFIIITYEEEKEIQTENIKIKVIPAWNFLLQG